MHALISPGPLVENSYTQWMYPQQLFLSCLSQYPTGEMSARDKESEHKIWTQNKEVYR